MSPYLKRYFESRVPKVEEALRRFSLRSRQEPDLIRKSMRYSLFAGGKRLRPVLVLAAAECCGERTRRVLPTACAVELIHTYSLIHDDLPAMDDDDLRRGKPTCHKVFGEGMAILAGDGLLTHAFELLAKNAAYGIPPARIPEAIRVIARGAGTQGMVGGQVRDLLAQGSHLNGNRLRVVRLVQYIHRHKTASLMAACVEAGAILAGAPRGERRALRSYGEHIGLAFQIADDILDVTGDKKKLGKRGSDLKNRKLTYPALYGLVASRTKARQLVQKAHRDLRVFGRRARVFHELADYIIQRDH
ncbi:MAG: polyprenyl synthetase family protein [Elusimicrobia bacterium]|nr:polyprenyl synthetase family protein [Elusimicrobiota bacterium]